MSDIAEQIEEIALTSSEEETSSEEPTGNYCWIKISL